MVFNSLSFVFFLVLTFFAWSAAKGRSRTVILLVMSYVFYAGWDPRYVPLLIFSTVLDFAVGKALDRTESPITRKALLAMSLAGNLGLLVYFKYWLFLLDAIGLASIPAASVRQEFNVSPMVPAGLSFYTFQTLGYAIDVYRRKTRACQSLLEFSLFVSFFPHLMAGPIMKADDLLSQIRRDRSPTADAVVQGVELFMLGMVKKVFIADNLGLLVDAIYADPVKWSGAGIGLAGIMFSAQVYCDFSGYSTMAIGIGRLFGFDLPQNFRYPLLATDPLDYRRRWHITMSEWFRENVFHPLGGTQRKPLRVAFNLLVVWALFGLWHGAAWTFVWWGLYNGVIQAVNRERLRRGLVFPQFFGKFVLGWLLTFGLNIPSSLMFRAGGLRQGLDLTKRLFTLEGGVSVPLLWWGVMATLFLVHLLAYKLYDENLLVKLPWAARITVLALATALILIGSSGRRPFVYFQF